MCKIALTFDTDWCNKNILNEVIESLKNYNLKFTIFYTDDWVIVDNLYHEIAFHPNIENKTENEIKLYFDSNLNIKKRKIFGIRTHKLYSSSTLNFILNNYNIIYQSNYVMFLQDNILPFLGLCNIYEIPIYFMDYYLMFFYKKVPLYKNFKKLFFKGDGIKVFAFHPIHIYLNTPNLQYYYKNKLNFKKNTKQYGIKNFFFEFLEDLKKYKTYFMRELI